MFKDGGEWKCLRIVSVLLDLFNDALKCSDYMASSVRRLLNKEVERMWKEVVVFRALLQCLFETD
jgi:hypothetical protein